MELWEIIALNQQAEFIAARLEVPFRRNSWKAIRRKDANPITGHHSENERAQISGFRIIAPAGIRPVGAAPMRVVNAPRGLGVTFFGWFP